MVPFTGLAVLLIAVKEGMFPDPEPGRPIDVFEFVQLKLTPEGVPERELPGTNVPSVTVVSGSKSTVPTGVIAPGIVTFPVTHWPAVGVKI